MISTESCAADVTAVRQPEQAPRSSMLVAKSGLYILVLVAVALGAGAYSLRQYGIFACQATGYHSDRYLGYCGATSYGDYDHGAIWFGLEPSARNAAASAQVLFIGNSRTEFAFSSNATAEWFSSRSESYYLLGFSHYENYTFEAPLLRRLHPRAKVYVINVDSFFDRQETGPGETVMQDQSARMNYKDKREWQSLHEAVCTSFRVVCGNDFAIFRSRPTGAWLVTGNGFKSKPVSYDDDIDYKMVATYTALGKQFLPTLPVGRGCTILTIVPTVKTRSASAKAIADALDLDLVAPRLTGLNTFDGYHLDPESAQRWSAAFLAEAGPQIRKCLAPYDQAHMAMTGAGVLSH
jgi:hypothetical protein